MVSKESPTQAESASPEVAQGESKAELAAESPEKAPPPGPEIETGPYVTWGLLVAALSAAIAIWVVRGTVPMRVATTLPVTFLPVLGVALSVVALWRRPRLWLVAVPLLLAHLGTIAYGLYHYFLSAR